MQRTLSTALALTLGAYAILAGTPAPVVAQAIDTLAIQAHTKVLADDLLEGRDTGSRGERLAALYITSQLRRLGIPGAALDGGYRQPVPLRRVTIDTGSTGLTIERKATGGVDNFRAGEHFIFGHGGRRAFSDFAGTPIFAGTSRAAREALAEIDDLDGRVVVILGTLGNDALSLIPDWIRRGATGVILLVRDPRHFSGIAANYGPSRLFVDAEIDDPVWQPDLPVLIAGPEITATLLAGSGVTQAALEGSTPFRAVPLDHQLHLTVNAVIQQLPAANIMARIPGRDPALRDEVVVYTAHYDHLGIGLPDSQGDSIYNGFSDNAAGNAMLLAIAAALRDHPPARSVLCLFFTGAGRGLLGSTYYVSAPVVPLEKVAAVINLDAGAPAAPPRNWKLAGGGLSTLGELAGRVAARNGWRGELTTASPNSDHWPFLYRGVPALFLIPGQEWEGVSRSQKEALQHRWEHYHQPADHWHPEFPLQGLERYAELARQIGVEVANAPEKPRFLGPAGR
jgi:hypothetical protein